VAIARASVCSWCSVSRSAGGNFVVVNASLLLLLLLLLLLSATVPL
jgi:hypothetical protein